MSKDIVFFANILTSTIHFTLTLELRFMYVKAKKYLGQHFLKDKNIAHQIVESLNLHDIENVLEIGPGMGVLTEFLLQNKTYKTTVIEIDGESIVYLKDRFFADNLPIIQDDFLQFDIKKYFDKPVCVIGNFPYNISSQILFKVLDNRDWVPQVVGMFQKEVAERIAAKPGSKTYGILSVLLQAYYQIEYLFTVNENVFAPPPKVKSAVIRVTRNEVNKIDCDEKLFIKLVKTAFNQRRKTIRNSIKTVFTNPAVDHPFLQLRPEQLSVEQFVELTNWVEKNMLTNG